MKTETKQKSKNLTKRHYFKAILLDNCTYLRNLKVLLPEELLCIESLIKNEFYKIEIFYKHFFSIPDFTKDLTVKFLLKSRLTKCGQFDCCDSKTCSPVITLYSIQEKITTDEFGSILAHEFAHFIDWRLCNLEGQCGGKTSKKYSDEVLLALKFKALQETKPEGIPFGGTSAERANSNIELFARYCEEFYRYCFYNENFRKSYTFEKNCMYVKADDFTKDLAKAITDYLKIDYKIIPKETIEINGNLYSKDKKELIRVCDNPAVKSFIIPDGVEIIKESAFSDCKILEAVHISNDVKVISNRAFSGCNSLTSVTGGKNVVFIGEMAFCSCENLKVVKEMDSLVYICRMAFNQNLQEFNFSKSIKIIEKMSFRKDFLPIENGVGDKLFDVF